MTVGDETLAQIDAFTLARDGHNELVMRPGDRDETTPPLPIGNREARFHYHSNGISELFLCQSFLGRPGLRFTVNPLLIAFRPHGGDDSWKLLGPTLVPFTAEDLQRYRQDQRRATDAESKHRRQLAIAQTAGYWSRRHGEARSYIRSLPRLDPPEVDGVSHPIDRFLLAKIDETNRDTAGPAGSPQAKRAIAILQERCSAATAKRASSAKSMGSLWLWQVAKSVK